MKTVNNLKNHAMKRFLLFNCFILAVALVSGQKSVDDLFKKYAGREGFTTVTINGNLLKLVSCLDDDDHDPFPATMTEIRILAQDDDHMKVENFYDLAMKDIDLNSYDEFMRVSESDQDVRMLVKSEGNKIKEFLMIAGGEDNALIQIKGIMTYEEARNFSADARKNHGMDIVSNHK
jgi:hypothetical protein